MVEVTGQEYDLAVLVYQFTARRQLLGDSTEGSYDAHGDQGQLLQSETIRGIEVEDQVEHIDLTLNRREGTEDQETDELEDIDELLATGPLYLHELLEEELAIGVAEGQQLAELVEQQQDALGALLQVVLPEPDVALPDLQQTPPLQLVGEGVQPPREVYPQLHRHLFQLRLAALFLQVDQRVHYAHVFYNLYILPGVLAID